MYICFFVSVIWFHCSCLLCVSFCELIFYVCFFMSFQVFACEFACGKTSNFLYNFFSFILFWFLCFDFCLIFNRSVLFDPFLSELSVILNKYITIHKITRHNTNYDIHTHTQTHTKTLTYNDTRSHTQWHTYEQNDTHLHTYWYTHAPWHGHI